MYEYEIMNNKTEEITYIYGYSLANAYKRNNLIPGEWLLLFYEYVD